MGARLPRWVAARWVVAAALLAALLYVALSAHATTGGTRPVVHLRPVSHQTSLLHGIILQHSAYLCVLGIRASLGPNGHSRTAFYMLCAHTTDARTWRWRKKMLHDHFYVLECVLRNAHHAHQLRHQPAHTRTNAQLTSRTNNLTPTAATRGAGTHPCVRMGRQTGARRHHRHVHCTVHSDHAA